MRWLLHFVLAVILSGAPLWAQGGHDGVVRPRTAPEPSDIALFVVAALAIWFTRRALRRRAAAARDRTRD